MKKKVLEAAIACNMPMYWEAYYGTLSLRVVSAVYETGRQRSRVIHETRSLLSAYQVSLDIFERGGALICSLFFDQDFDFWRYGWRPEMSDMRERLRLLDITPKRTQPLWEEFARMVRR
jgi:hypothetical protein